MAGTVDPGAVTAARDAAAVGAPPDGPPTPGAPGAPAAPATDDKRWGIDLARPDDDGGIRALLRSQALGGRVRIALTREPCAAWAAQVGGDRVSTVVVRDGVTGFIAGVGQRCVRAVWLNGAPARLGYLGLLRRDPALRNRADLLAAGFHRLWRDRAADELPFDLTSIVDDNLPAQRLLRRGGRGLPVYERLCDWVTAVVPVGPCRQRMSSDLRSGTPADVPDLSRLLQHEWRQYQFAPVWEPEDLLSADRCRGLRPWDFILVGDGTPRACAALWDQRGFKQAVVAGYEARLARWRWAVNAWRRARREPPLPAPGQAFDLAYLSHLAVRPDDDDALMALLAAAMKSARQRGVQLLATGFADSSPMAGVMRRCLRRTGSRRWREYRSTLFLVRPAESAPVAPRLDARPVHVEIATL